MNYEFYQTLLISEDTIKTNTKIADNLESKELFPAIQRAQDIDLQNIIGSDLYRGLQSKIYNNEINNDENENYKFLLDVFIQPFLLEIIISNLIFESAGSIHNTGYVQPNDSHFYQVDRDNRLTMVDQHKQFASHYQKMLQNYLRENKKLFPELSSCGDLDYLQEEQLYSASYTDIWLGGKVGRKIKNKK